MKNGFYPTRQTVQTTPDQNLEFLRTTIMQLKTALCNIAHDSFPVQTFIIQTLDADEDGNLYFRLFKPAVTSVNIENFGMRLTYFPQSFDYYIQVKALATFEKNDPGIFFIDDEGKLQQHCDTMMVKAKIMEADYYEKGEPFLSKNFLTNLRQGVSAFSKFLSP